MFVLIDMSFTGNTINYKQIWTAAYQETHYKQPVFRAFADTRFANSLPNGASIKWSYDADIDAPDLATSGAYTVENRTVNDETLTVNQIPSGTFRIPGPQKIQDHRPTMEKWANKAMNRIFWKMDMKMLGEMAANAVSLVDASDPIAGNGSAASSTTVASTPITVSTGNAAAVFAAARVRLRNQNIIYDENKRFTGDVKFDATSKFPIAAIPAELDAQLLLAIGFKPGDVGDQTLLSGFRDKLFGFNVFYSGALPCTANLTVGSGSNIQNGDYLYIGSSAANFGGYGTSGGIRFKFVTGSVSSAGDILIDGSQDYTTLDTLLTIACAAPYTDSTTVYKGFTRASGTIYQRQILDGLAKSVHATTLQGTSSATSLIGTLCVLGQGAVPVSTTSSYITVSNQAVHAIFGVSQSIALVMQRTPELSISAGEIVGNGASGGYVARDFVTWALAGWNVFKTHTYQLVDVPIASSTFAQPANTYN